MSHSNMNTKEILRKKHPKNPLVVIMDSDGDKSLATILEGQYRGIHLKEKRQDSQNEDNMTQSSIG